eukprot:scaffold83511_cov36-Phaeocystis_antarctica.AAC.2
MRNTAWPRDGAPSPTISGCGAGNQPPSPSPADLAKNWGPGLAGSPMNLLQNQQPLSNGGLSASAIMPGPTFDERPTFAP